ncbi:MAG: hypothetical protein GX409_08520 [candidate division Zixibacteria bacterium]|nr:hypothetical protein [candidate division Zixibacteria bacterium]
MRRICAILSIIFLFVVSLCGHTRNCLCFVYVGVSELCCADNCHHREKSTQPADCCDNNIACDNHTGDYCEKYAGLAGGRDFGGTKDCNSNCVYLTPSFIAEGPNRLIFFGADNLTLITATTPLVKAKIEQARLVDYIPSRGVDISIPSTVLRI